MWDEVRVGEPLPSVAFPINVYRLVLEAGANRDFNSIHHNTEWAQARGASEMYANGTFLIGMWERAIRDWIGEAGTIRTIRGFRMRSFNVVGDTTWVHASVIATERTADAGLVTIEVRSQNANGTTVGPGEVVCTLPLAGEVLL